MVKYMNYEQKTMTPQQKAIREIRLQKFSRILSNKYNLELKLTTNTLTIGSTDTTSKIVIRDILDSDANKNLLLQKGVTLHEIGHVLFTRNKVWDGDFGLEYIDFNLINIIEDGRIEERMSRLYNKSRLYFTYSNQDILKYNKVEVEKALADWENKGKVCIYDFLLRQAKKSTGIPQPPKEMINKLIDMIGTSAYNKLMKLTKKAVLTEDKEVLYYTTYELYNFINSLFNGFTKQYTNNVSKTSTHSVENCGAATRTMQEQSEVDKQHQESIEEALEVQAEELNESHDTQDGSMELPVSTPSTEAKEDETVEGDGQGDDLKISEPVDEDSDVGEESYTEDYDDYEEDLNNITGGDSSSNILSSIEESLENIAEDELMVERQMLQQDDIIGNFDSYDRANSNYSKNILNRCRKVNLVGCDNHAKRITHVMKAIAQPGHKWSSNHTRGTLDLTKLVRTVGGNTNQPKVFKKYHFQNGVDLAATILLDASGSMSSNIGKRGERHNTAFIATQAAYTIAKALDECDYKNEVVYFNGSTEFGVKAFNQKIDYTKNNFRAVAYGGTPLARSLKGARKSLQKQNSKQKVVFVVTDGAPKNPSICSKIINQMEREGVIVIGIIIGYGNLDVDRYFKFFNHKVSCNNVLQLTNKMDVAIRKILLSMRRQ